MPRVSLSDLKRRLLAHGFVYLISETVADLDTSIYRHPHHNECARLWEWQDEGRVRFRPMDAGQAVSTVTSILRMSGVMAGRATELARERINRILLESKEEERG